LPRTATCSRAWRERLPERIAVLKSRLRLSRPARRSVPSRPSGRATGSKLEGEPLPATLSPTRQHFASALRRHARAEPVLSLPGNALRLPRPLRHGTSPIAWATEYR
jgi:hypothetical protein